jgi:hypothetical protein
MITHFDVGGDRSPGLLATVTSATGTPGTWPAEDSSTHSANEFSCVILGSPPLFNAGRLGEVSCKGFLGESVPGFGQHY